MSFTLLKFLGTGSVGGMFIGTAIGFQLPSSSSFYLKLAKVCVGDITEICTVTFGSDDFCSAN